MLIVVLCVFALASGQDIDFDLPTAASDDNGKMDTSYGVYKNQTDQPINANMGINQTTPAPGTTSNPITTPLATSKAASTVGNVVTSAATPNNTTISQNVTTTIAPNTTPRPSSAETTMSFALVTCLGLATVATLR